MDKNLVKNLWNLEILKNSDTVILDLLSSFYKQNLVFSDHKSK